MRSVGMGWDRVERGASAEIWMRNDMVQQNHLAIMRCLTKLIRTAFVFICLFECKVHNAPNTRAYMFLRFVKGES